MPRSSGTPTLCLSTQTQGVRQAARAPCPRLFLFFFFILFGGRVKLTLFFFSSKLYETTLFLCGVFETDFSG